MSSFEGSIIAYSGHAFSLCVNCQTTFISCCNKDMAALGENHKDRDLEIQGNLAYGAINEAQMQTGYQAANISTEQNEAYGMSVQERAYDNYVINQLVYEEPLQQTAVTESQNAGPAYDEIPPSLPPPPLHWQTQQDRVVPLVTVQQPMAPQPPPTSGPVQDYGVCPMVFGVVMLFVALVCGGLLGVACSVPAVMFATNATTWSAAGDYEKARRYRRWSICCSVSTVVFIVFVYVVLTATLVGVICGVGVC